MTKPMPFVQHPFPQPGEVRTDAACRPAPYDGVPGDCGTIYTEAEQPDPSPAGAADDAAVDLSRSLPRVDEAARVLETVAARMLPDVMRSPIMVPLPTASDPVPPTTLTGSLAVAFELGVNAERLRLNAVARGVRG